MVLAQKLAISPREPSQSRGTAIHPGIRKASRSSWGRGPGAGEYDLPPRNALQPAAPGVGSTRKMPEPKARANDSRREMRRRRSYSSPRHLELGVGGEQGLGEHVVEREHA